MTAESLLTALVPYEVTAENGELSVSRDSPPELVSRVEILHTGVRALLTGKKWFGSTAADGVRPLVIELNPAKMLPPRIVLLCVEGDAGWDRLPPAIRIDRPELCAVEKEQPDRNRGPQPPRSDATDPKLPRTRRRSVPPWPCQRR